MILDPGGSQIHILLINNDSLCLCLSISFSLSFSPFALFCFSHKATEEDEKWKKLDSGQGYVLTE